MKHPNTKFIFFFTALAFFCFCQTSFADTVYPGSVSSDTTWSPPNVYVIDSSFSVASGTTLTIEPGTVVKVRVTGYLGQGIQGRIVAHGTNEAPIYFTSFYNDNVGGDTDGGGASSGSPGDWQGLYFKPGSEGSLDHVDLSYAGYGGYGYGDVIGIENDGGILNIQNSVIRDNWRIYSDGGGGYRPYGRGVYGKSGIISVTNSIIDNNVDGIVIDSGDAVISGNIIKNNDGYFHSGKGLHVYGSGELSVLNNTFTGNGRTAFVEVSRDFIHSGNTSDDFTNRGFEMGGVISKNTTLNSDDLPIIVNSITVPTDKTLTIKPGTVLKMSTYSGIYVNGGNLIAKGTADKKIYITSLRDDSITGDTNGDGDITVPAPKNWASIFLESGSRAEFDNVTVRYGGYNWNGEYLNVAAAIYQRGANFSVNNSVFEYNRSADIFQDAGTTNITNSEFKNSDFGIFVRGGPDINISNSSFVGHIGLAINNEGTSQIDARNNWWGSSDGPKDLSVSGPTGNGDKIYKNILYDPWLTSWPPAGETKINPVIIVPGIMGSAKKNGKWVIDPILHTYDDLIDTLNANGYTPDVDLFTFPYEWRDSNTITANLLDNKISEVKQTCLAQAASSEFEDLDCGKVDLVTHSMGGLVARAYIQSGIYDNDIDQLIFLGTPHRGSADAYLTWEAGEFRPDDKYSLFAKVKFSVEAAKNLYPSLFSYIQNRPISSVQELLPVFNYIKDKNTGIVRGYPDNYPRNLFLEALNTNANIQNLLNSGVKIVNIVGDVNPAVTVKNIRVVAGENPLWLNGKPENFDVKTGDRGLEMGEGDGTVTIHGATLDSLVQNETWPNVEHQGLPRETSGRIFNLLTGEIADSVIIRSWPENLFSIHLQSPIDVLITDPNGRKMGKNFGTGGEYDEIPGAFYSGFNNGDEEYITIPNPLDGEYKIEIIGTDNGGEYGVVASYISDEISTTTEHSGVIGTGQISNLEVTVDNANPENTTIESTDPITSSTLLNHIELFYRWGWITGEEAYEKLRNWAQSIVRMNAKTKFVDKKLADMLSKALPKMLEGGDINTSAYNLLIKDLQYLINN